MFSVLVQSKYSIILGIKDVSQGILSLIFETTWSPHLLLLLKTNRSTKPREANKATHTPPPQSIRNFPLYTLPRKFLFPLNLSSRHPPTPTGDNLLAVLSLTVVRKRESSAIFPSSTGRAQVISTFLSL